MSSVSERFRRAWNAFRTRSETESAVNVSPSVYSAHAFLPDSSYSRRYSEKTLITAIQNRIAIDVASNTIQHIVANENGLFQEVVDSSLNDIFNFEANIDQTGRTFIQDMVMAICEEGCIACVPVDTDIAPTYGVEYNIYSMYLGKITQFMTNDVEIDLYDNRTGIHKHIRRPKDTVAIIYNPLYSVMNDDNSVVKRLINKMALLDAVDNQLASDKLNMIIQLPYTVRNEKKLEEAEKRLTNVQMQLENNKLGIAYIDGTEKIIQLSRPLDNNFLQQIDSMKTEMYNQLGMTEEVFKGTADEQAMLNYYTRTIEPFLGAICDEFRRKFLTERQRRNGETIHYFRNPFKLVPLSQIAEIADKFTRNEIMSTNDIRRLVGLKPVDDDRANELRNKNINQSDNAETPVNTGDGTTSGKPLPPAAPQGQY